MNEAAKAMGSTLGVIGVAGPDAGDFLRNQLTNDVRRLGSDRHFLAAWCDPKGRVLMLARVAVFEQRYLLIVPRSMITALIQRLRMYVLRAKVEVTDESDRFRLAGLCSNDLPDPDATDIRDDVITLGLPAGQTNPQRAMLLAGHASSLPPDSMAVDDSRWQLGQIDAGIPQITLETQNTFVPQMLNLHWLHAVDFDKGCYPGQEIVARLHYRGRLTRRVYRLQWNAEQPPAAGSLITTDSDDNAGTVLQAAADGTGHGRLLAVLKTARATVASLRCGSASLQTLDLPYATPD
jgi:folate-binding protein YgfZ